MKKGSTPQSAKSGKKSTKPKHNWTFLSNHAHVLICLSRDPDMRLKDLATNVGITERAVICIVEDLEDAKVLNRTKEGRRNKYTIFPNIPLRHTLEAHKTIGNLIKLLK
jgi:DNA-binding MarR family transcriptional regulator